ncbi:Flagellar motor rotation protein MotB [hydrothermal vent metagenome]|uniref:Flagellar motor rotation protein MotB n=1 Tax=hydrothermal vent metagenome TaxID=652676 RepID=A0A3B1CIE8_9ZZZZ
MAISAAQKKKKKKGKGDDFDPDFWMVTFGDLLSLLLTFFVLLFSMATLDDKSLKEMFSTFAGGAGVLMFSDTFPKEMQIPESAFMPKQFQVSQFIKFLQKESKKEKALSTESSNLVEAMLMEDVSIKKRGPTFILSFQNKQMFSAGSSEISPKLASILKRLGGVLRFSSTRIIIEGHTDDIPISTPRYPSNWELSSARAARVMRFFLENTSIDQDRISIAGFGDSKPVVRNINDAFRARNRRVDILIVQAAGV